MAERSLFKALIDQIILRNNRNDYFHRSTILKSSRLFLFYRFWMSSYFIVWFIVQASLEELPKHFIYLTTWGESLLNLYFITSFVMSSYLYWNPESVYDQLNGYVYFLQWMSNFLRIIAFDMGFSLSIAYWLLLRTEDTIFSWHVHLVNSIAIVMDLIVCDNPVFLIQFVWSTGLGLVYILHSLLLYYFAQGEEYKILYEKTLDWGNYPKTSLLVVLSVAFVVMPIAHLVQYVIFTAKQKCIKGKYPSPTNIDEIDSGSDNKLDNKLDIELLNEGK